MSIRTELSERALALRAQADKIRARAKAEADALDAQALVLLDLVRRITTQAEALIDEVNRVLGR